MNKDTEVLVGEYDIDNKVFSNIEEIKNIEYAPLVIYNAYKRGEKLTTNISEWYRGRGIPSWRDDLDLLLARLNVNTPEELLDKAFGLSLSDQYWVKPSDSSI